MIMGNKGFSLPCSSAAQIIIIIIIVFLHGVPTGSAYLEQ